MTDKGRALVFNTSGQVSLQGDQTLLLYADPNLYLSVQSAQVTILARKIDRLTDSLVFEYSKGYEATSSSQHEGMSLLESLRQNQKRMKAAATLTGCLQAESGPSSHPCRVMATAKELQKTSVAVADMVFSFAAERGLKLAAASSDWSALWAVLTSKDLPEEHALRGIALANVNFMKMLNS